MVVFVDDLNMPKRDSYGTQQPIALLKFLIERGHMYDRSEPGDNDRLQKKTFRDLQYVAAMAPPGGGRSVVDPRFTSLFSVFSITFPSQESLQRIYSSILTRHLENFSDEVKNVGTKITDVTLKLYSQLTAQLPPTPSKFHYVFNLRDLSRVYEGLLLSTPEKFGTAGALIRLWRNETMRVFHDRLISAKDQTLVAENIIGGLIKEHFPTEAPIANANPLLYGDYRLVNSELENPQLYEDLQDYDHARRLVLSFV